MIMVNFVINNYDCEFFFPSLINDDNLIVNNYIKLGWVQCQLFGDNDIQIWTDEVHGNADDDKLKSHHHSDKFHLKDRIDSRWETGEMFIFTW